MFVPQIGRVVWRALVRELPQALHVGFLYAAAVLLA